MDATSAARDFVADDLADIRAGLDRQHHRAIEAQLAVHRAGAADIHAQHFLLAPVPAGVVLFLDVNAAAHVRTRLQVDVAIARDQRSADLGAVERDTARDRRRVAAYARAIAERQAAVHGRSFAR